jgi:hypothetical protein
MKKEEVLKLRPVKLGKLSNNDANDYNDKSKISTPYTKPNSGSPANKQLKSSKQPSDLFKLQQVQVPLPPLLSSLSFFLMHSSTFGACQSCKQVAEKLVIGHEHRRPGVRCSFGRPKSKLIPFSTYIIKSYMNNFYI